MSEREQRLNDQLRTFNRRATDRSHSLDYALDRVREANNRYTNNKAKQYADPLLSVGIIGIIKFFIGAVLFLGAIWYVGYWFSQGMLKP